MCQRPFATCSGRSGIRRDPVGLEPLSAGGEPVIDEHVQQWVTNVRHAGALLVPIERVSVPGVPYEDSDGRSRGRVYPGAVRKKEAIREPLHACTPDGPGASPVPLCGRALSRLNRRCAPPKRAVSSHTIETVMVCFRTVVLFACCLLSAETASATWSVIAVDRATGRVVISSATCVPQRAFAGFPAKDLRDVQAIVVP